MTRVERIWKLHRTIVDPASDIEEVRRAKRALLFALATPDKMHNAAIPASERRKRLTRHCEKSVFCEGPFS